MRDFTSSDKTPVLRSKRRTAGTWRSELARSTPAARIEAVERLNRGLLVHRKDRYMLRVG